MEYEGFIMYKDINTYAEVFYKIGDTHINI